MQNLTAHYNIIFNANNILQQKQDDYALAFIDSYNELLNVYQDTAATHTTSLDKDLQLAVDKANKIIYGKDQSHYVGDAYLIMGKANYLGGNYFDAAEYFSYVIRSYPKQVSLMQEAQVWKARTLLYLDQPTPAKLVLDTAFENINPKKNNPADVYATKLQYDINVKDYADAEIMAKQAIQYSSIKKQRLRWTFILAQLQEINQKNDEALANYGKIANSNANFEMAFNADLNRIRIEDTRNGVKLSRTDRLKSLLKNPNNKEFKDQIYYQLGQIYLGDKDYDNAIKYYKLSIRSSVKNQNQKGLSYLRIADIDFNNKVDYINAKKYYDSTLTTLSPSYPGYRLIQKKTSNLQLLTDRLRIIAHEDTLQMLANLDEKTRSLKIDTMVKDMIMEQQAALNSLKAASTNASNTAANTVFNTPGGSNFYFYNSNAVSQGYNDFKKQWGSRKLEDNWRRSNRSNSDQANSLNSVRNLDPDAVGQPASVAKTAVAAKDYRQQIIADLPLTPDLLAQSNMRIYNAYFDIANFYRDILEDKKEAIATYLLIEKRFPNNPNQAAIYYSLFRLYSQLNDDAQAKIYKDKVLKDYADTPFAKVILDPDYGKKMDDQYAEFNSLYSQVYDLYIQRKYNAVIARVDTVQKQYPHNRLSAQLAYLRALAAGHQESITQFKTDLTQIMTTYPGDMLIVPLVKQHLQYINTNPAEIASRQYALYTRDSTEVMFTPPVANQKQTEYRKPGHYSLFSQVADVRKPEKKDSLAVNKPVVRHTAPAGMFSMRDSTNYYFVINISNDNTNLASSRFGIGQFNRANYTKTDISHQLMQVGNNNRLIFVGKFNGLANVKAYARGIVPLLPDIMKISKDKYSFFIITKENLDKLADQKTLENYIDYYQNNY
ncbi:type IX secretion system periplasmic lipoprotein PorW/SprE [Mucilaginibacter mallensis]|nr:tetratricopeptide repeat protein [Mucilaginibacter mallensis]